MEGLFMMGGLFWVVLLVICICIVIAPLIIWRNTNRMIEVLALIAIKNGVNGEELRAVLLGAKAKTKPNNTERICTKCLATRPATERKCRFCGQEPDMADRKIECTECGQDITHMPPECPKCGKRFTYVQNEIIGGIP